MVASSGGGFDHGSEFEYPDTFAIFALLGAAAGAVNHRVLVNADGEPAVFTNTYTVLYGPSGSRKSTAIRHGTYLLNEAVEETPTLPQSFTMESLISRLARDSEEKGKGSGLIVSHELSDLIGGAEYKAGNTKFLTDIWDCPGVWMRETQTHAQEVIENPYICLLAASAPDWLEMTDPAQLAGGFLRRMMFVVEFGKKRENPAPKRDVVLFKALAKVFRQRVGPDAFGPTEMLLTPAARAVAAEWYTKTVLPIQHGGSERESQFASCMQAHALKLAGLVSILEYGSVKELDAPALTVGQGLIELLVPGTFHAYRSLVPTAFARLRAAVMRLVRAEKGEIGLRDLATKITDGHGVDNKQFNSALSSLVRDARLQVEGTKVRAL